MRFVINPFTDLLDCAQLSGSGAPPVETVTGNTGGPVGPDPTTFNLNIVGDNATGLTVAGNAGTYTLTIQGLASSTTQVGTTRYATNAEAAAQTIGTAALTPANITSMFSSNPLPASQGGTGLSSPAAHSLLVTNGSSPFTVLGVAANGQIPIGSIGSDPVLANITSLDMTVTITNGPGSIDLSAAGAGSLTFDADSGSATAAGGIIQFFGNSAQGVSSSASGNTVTYTVADATTSTKGVSSYNTSNFTVTTGAVSSKPITVTSGNNITATASWDLGGAASIAVSGTTNHAIQLGNASGSLTSLGVATNGQLPIGSTGADPVLSTLTAGTGVSITNGAGSITISASASVATTYTADSGSAAPSANNLNLLGSGSITSSATGSTVTYQLTGLTNHNVLVGAGTATITKVAPSATSGVPLISNGSSADPSFGTAVVAGGGTGATSFTAYSVICGGTTSTGALQNVSGVGTATQVLTSNGAGALPSWQAAPAGKLVLISSQTASNSANLVFNNLGGYQNYLLVMNGFQPITNGANLRLVVSQNNGSTYVTSGYGSGLNYSAYNSASLSNANSTADFIISGSTSNGGNYCGTLTLYNFNLATFVTVSGNGSWNDTNLATVGFGTIGGSGTTGVTAFKLQYSTGNINSGIATLYALAQS